MSRRRVLPGGAGYIPTVYVGTALLDLAPSHRRPNTWETQCACDFSLSDQKVASVQVQRLRGHWEKADLAQGMMVFAGLA